MQKENHEEDSLQTRNISTICDVYHLPSSSEVLNSVTNVSFLMQHPKSDRMMQYWEFKANFDSRREWGRQVIKRGRGFCPVNIDENRKRLPTEKYLPLTHPIFTGRVFRWGGIVNRPCVKQTPKGKHHIKEWEMSVLIIAKMFCRSIVDPIEHLVKGGLVYKM